MTKAVKDVMTPSPATMQTTETIADAARMMREKDIGDVIVMNDGSLCGIVTDRDIVVRAIAKACDANTKLGEICSKDVTTVSPEENLGAAIQIMEPKALRRLPVVEDGPLVGVVSIGELAMEREQKSALAKVSAAPANK